MFDEERSSDPCVVWKEQPEEETAVIVDELLSRRTKQLHVSTRSEIIMSIVAALFFVAVLTWRLPQGGLELPPVASAAVALWVGITAFRFRRILWQSDAPPNTAAPGLSYYRQELELRRDHLRNAWLWHGPILLAALLFTASFTGGAFPGVGRLRSAAPLLAILAVWTAVGVRRRFRQAAELQSEIDEIAHLEEVQ
jgi:hypothetical protein